MVLYYDTSDIQRLPDFISLPFSPLTLSLGFSVSLLVHTSRISYSQELILSILVTSLFVDGKQCKIDHSLVFKFFFNEALKFFFFQF